MKNTNEIFFSENWNNKLDCIVFTSVREFTAARWKKYHNHEGEVFKVWVKPCEYSGPKKLYTSARLVGATWDLLKNIDHHLLILDTGTFNYMSVFRRLGLDYDSKVILTIFQQEKQKVKKHG